MRPTSHETDPRVADSAVTSDGHGAAQVLPWRPGDTWREQDGALDVWRLPLARQAHGHRPVLTEEERRRAARLVVPAKRRQFERTRTALRQVLSRVLGLAPLEVPLEVGEHGKPRVPGGPSFNVSHSGDLALVAVTPAPDRALGVDLERVDERRPLARMARRFFSAEEARRHAAVPEQSRALDFYRRWSLKEAYVKALGTGLTHSSRAFTLLDDPSCWHWRPLLERDERFLETARSWVFADGWAAWGDRRYAVAVCCDRPLILRTWDLPGNLPADLGGDLARSQS